MEDESDNMKFSVIICTYQRPTQIFTVIKSIYLQSVLPMEILIIDGSIDDLTTRLIKENFKEKNNLFYIKVESEQRGLTKQRNVGVRKIAHDSEIVIFLDDDLILEPEFFKNIIATFQNNEVIGCDGFITNENFWYPSLDRIEKKSLRIINFDGYYLKLSSRDFVRRLLGLYPTNIQPGKIPKYGHGKTSLPPTGKLYEVDHLMGCMMAYRTEIFKQISFSSFFEGYGLYEDFDFSVRASKYGKLITNTSARCEHHHAPGGRPNKFKYGSMVIWNGYYVWRLKYPKLEFRYILKWYVINIYLIVTLFSGVLFGANRKEFFGEIIGRLNSYLKLFYSKPKIQY